MKSVGEGTTKTRVNINIFLSQDLLDDGLSDNDGPSNAESQVFNSKSSSNSSSNGNPSKIASNSEVSSTASSRLSVNARRAQFQASRRIMSAPIRPMNLDDSKNKRKTRKKKVIRDKDEPDDSPDELSDSPEPRKPISQPSPPKAPKAKALTTRSRSVLGCDQIGIETLVSMLSSGGSDSEKDEPQQVQQQAPKPDVPKPRNVLRKTVSFQDDDSFLQSTLTKDPFVNRRSTNVPFAGRMRNTRSLFGQEISNLYLPNTVNVQEKLEAKSENDLNSPNKTKEELDSEKTKIKTTCGEEKTDDKKTQDKQTPKEQECWRLYEKMKKTGLNVSYDTILRGILKPSELRLLEKQKKFLNDIEEKPIECSETQPETQKVN